MTDEDKGKNPDQVIIDRAKRFLTRAIEAETQNRQEGLIALKFSKLGEQWEANNVQSRQLESRPCLTINKVEAFCKQVTNQQRQQRPRIKVHAVSDGADVKIANVIAGIVRHIEVNSNADTAYDTAFDSAVHIGWGYFRLRHDFINETSFDQDIFIDTVDNPFSVYFDPSSTLPDGSDAGECLITDQLTKAQFKSQYPDADDGSSFTNGGQGDEMSEWLTPDAIRIAEYYYLEDKKDILVMLSNNSIAWKSELPELPQLQQSGLSIVAERPSHRRMVKWCKLTAMEVLEKRDVPGPYIPVIPVYGECVVIDGRRRRFGLVKHAMDPQRMLNFWKTACTESVALAPKAKWLIGEGQDEGFENEWAAANVSTAPVLHWKKRGLEGVEYPEPQRLQPEPPPAGMIENANMLSEDLTAVLGMVEPAQRIGGNVSGKALNSEKQQGDNATFHYYDNLTRSISHAGKIILGWMPKIYDTQRVVRIIGEDGRPDQITVNERNEIGETLNNITVGTYDVVMDTGPGYNSKRIEAVDSFMQLLSTPLGEEVAKAGADLAVRAMDFPGAEALADRLAAANPLANIDEQSDIPPQAQMMIKGLQQQVQQMQQALQGAQMEQKYKGSIIKMQEDAETNREHMRLTVRAHDVDSKERTTLQKENLENKAWMEDVHTKAHTALSVAEINAIAKLLDNHMKANQIERAANEEERELER